MYNTLRRLLSDDEFTVVESFDIPGREATFAKAPRFLFNSQVGPRLNRWLREAGSGEFGLWAHQAKALEALGRGENVVISTGTASGKSLVFQAVALHRVLCAPDSRVIVFYPLKALVKDQLISWRKMARTLNVDEEIIGRIDGMCSPKSGQTSSTRSNRRYDGRCVPRLDDVPTSNATSQEFCSFDFDPCYG